MNTDTRSRAAWRIRLGEWIAQTRVERALIALIVINAVILGLETFPSIMERHGAWLKARGVLPATKQDDGWTAAAGYRDYLGAEHHRAITLTDTMLTCTDTLSGTAKKAVLRWRLAPGEWQLTDQGVECGGVRVQVHSDTEIAIRLTDGWEARHYLEKTALPVLEIETTVPATLTSEITF